MKYALAFFLLILSSCVYDKLSKIMDVQNTSSLNLRLIYGDSNITDEQLFYRSKYSIAPNSKMEIFGPDSRDMALSRTFYIFNSDTLNDMIRKNLIKGIVKQCLLKKITLTESDLRKTKNIFFP